jgi:hypothetical protein
LLDVHGHAPAHRLGVVPGAPEQQQRHQPKHQRSLDRALLNGQCLRLVGNAPASAASWPRRQSALPRPQHTGRKDGPVGLEHDHQQCDRGHQEAKTATTAAMRRRQDGRRPPQACGAASGSRPSQPTPTANRQISATNGGPPAPAACVTALPQFRPRRLRSGIYRAPTRRSTRIGGYKSSSGTVPVCGLTPRCCVRGVRKTGYGAPDDRTRRGHIVTSGPLPAHTAVPWPP